MYRIYTLNKPLCIVEDTVTTTWVLISAVLTMPEWIISLLSIWQQFYLHLNYLQAVSFLYCDTVHCFLSLSYIALPGCSALRCIMLLHQLHTLAALKHIIFTKYSTKIRLGEVWDLSYVSVDKMFQMTKLMLELHIIYILGQETVEMWIPTLK